MIYNIVYIDLYIYTNSYTYTNYLEASLSYVDVVSGRGRRRQDQQFPRA